MNTETLIRYKEWFSNYVQTFYYTNEKDQKNIELKEIHSGHVFKNMTDIAQGVFGSEDEINAASAVGLLHDVGRFPQYAKYKTFKDAVSVNHGVLGSEVLAQDGVLRELSPALRDIILQSVKYHNAYKLPSGLTPETLTYLKMVRDADKLDIWRVFTEEIFTQNKTDRPSAVMLGFPVTDNYSKEILKSVYSMKLAKLADVKCENDFKLLQLTWIFDLNFKKSFSILIERNYIDTMVDTLPDTSEINGLRQVLKDYCNLQINQRQC
ncbi:MAG: HD domain-containing protein [Nitrospirae bacterium]|nr:HD domain-containing protein [Nitrospirota bacterium]MBF0536434.1 HD domain-containing protein [Nitrospirota bacterium]MBF0618355.1 HD domain-containing protein [Nitrospirota bacterium]